MRVADDTGILGLQENNDVTGNIPTEIGTLTNLGKWVKLNKQTVTFVLDFIWLVSHTNHLWQRNLVWAASTQNQEYPPKLAS